VNARLLHRRLEMVSHSAYCDVQLPRRGRQILARGDRGDHGLFAWVSEIEWPRISRECGDIPSLCAVSITTRRASVLAKTSSAGPLTGMTISMAQAMNRPADAKNVGAQFAPNAARDRLIQPDLFAVQAQSDATACHAEQIRDKAVGGFVSVYDPSVGAQSEHCQTLTRKNSNWSLARLSTVVWQIVAAACKCGAIWSSFCVSSGRNAPSLSDR